ncbi:MAG: serine hydrolase domain-containing protein, partial [Pyrinomonadaceae bacterium]
MSSKFKVQSSKSVNHIFNNKSGFYLFAVFFLLTVYCSLITAQSLTVAQPQTVGMSAEKLNQIDGLVEKAIADKKMPGAVVVVGHKGKIVYRKAFGNRALVPTQEKMTVDTIFDVASLTKPIATATSIMILVERGQIRLNDTIGKFIPEIQDENVEKMTVDTIFDVASLTKP